MRWTVRTATRVTPARFSGQVEGEMKEAAEISMGTEVSDEDTTNILMLCDQVTHTQSE